jgi:hypothetical protein
MKLTVKAACLQVHAYFHENFGNVLKENHYEVIKRRNFDKANSAYNPRKLPKSCRNTHK